MGGPYPWGYANLGTKNLGPLYFVPPCENRFLVLCFSTIGWHACIHPFLHASIQIINRRGGKVLKCAENLLLELMEGLATHGIHFLLNKWPHIFNRVKIWAVGWVTKKQIHMWARVFLPPLIQSFHSSLLAWWTVVLLQLPWRNSVRRKDPLPLTQAEMSSLRDFCILVLWCFLRFGPSYWSKWTCVCLYQQLNGAWWPQT